MSVPFKIVSRDGVPFSVSLSGAELLAPILEKASEYAASTAADAEAAANSSYRVSPMFPGITPHAAMANLIRVDGVQGLPDDKIIYATVFYWSGGNFRAVFNIADPDGSDAEEFASLLVASAGFTGEQRITLRDPLDTEDRMEIVTVFGDGSAWSSNMFDGGTKDNARLSRLAFEQGPIEIGNAQTSALAIVNDLYRPWANPTVTDRVLLRLIKDAWAEQSDPGHDYVFRVGLDTYTLGVLHYRVRIHMYDPQLSAVVARCEFAIPTTDLGGDTIQDYLNANYPFLIGAGALAGSPWGGVDYYGNSFALHVDWTGAQFNRALPTATDPAVAGLRRGRVISRIEMHDRFLQASEPARLITFGSGSADFTSLADVEVSLRLGYAGSYTLTDWPAHAVSFTHQVAAEYAGTAPVTINLNDLPVPRFMTVIGNGLVTFTGTASRILQQIYSTRLRGCRLVVTPDEYADHIDILNTINKPGVDGVLRHSETIVLEDFIAEPSGTGHNANLLGCGMSNGKVMAFRRGVVRRLAGSTSAISLILIHNNPDTVVPGHVEIEDLTLSKGGASGPDILLQTLYDQPNAPHTFSIKTSDVNEVAHEFAGGLSTTAWKRRGKSSATTMASVFNP